MCSYYFEASFYNLDYEKIKYLYKNLFIDSSTLHHYLDLKTREFLNPQVNFYLNIAKIENFHEEKYFRIKKNNLIVF